MDSGKTRQLLPKVLVVDPSTAGISGDRVVSALVDLGASEKRALEAMLATRDSLAGCSRLDISFEEVKSGGFRAKRLRIEAKESRRERKAQELMDALKASCFALELSEPATAFAVRTLRTLIEAEGKLHGEETTKVHLHEAGSIDTLVDIIGTASALHDLRLLHGVRVVSMPVAAGGGRLTFSHGTVPVPVPAVLEMARTHGLELRGGPIEGELSTPTGIAILANLAGETVQFYPAIKPEAVGLGAGSSEFPGLPNILRLTLGQAVPPSVKESIVVLETNIDDITGEYLAHASEALMEAGASDISIIPALSKKGRPSYLLRVIADASKSQELADRVMVETGTLGVRVTPVTRYVSNRRVVPVEIELRGRKVKINVKVSRNAQGELVAAKPEYRDILRLSRETGATARILYSEVLAAVGQKFS